MEKSKTISLLLINIKTIKGKFKLNHASHIFVKN